ncbi:hypothetical protein PG990_009390 [Apiospora arundinis]|uniref:Proline rich protein 5MeD n=1 Tax=Apiospora arundinis TaxID=335852 RepID=A0ABR2ISK4_9PEZI
MGYNSLDNYLYAAIGTTPGNLLRISANGDSQTLGSLGLIKAANTGDVDEAGYYWASTGGNEYVQFDLRPTGTFGALVTSGVSNPKPAFPILDWAYVPKGGGWAGGDFLWALGGEELLPLGNILTLNTYLLQFNRATKAWSSVRNFGNIAGQILEGKNTWGAVYAGDDGFLYGSENFSGEIWKFPLPGNPNPAGKVSSGPKSTNNDGARCINAKGL